MKNSKWIVYGLMALGLPVRAGENNEAARMAELLQLDLMALSEVEVKLDDVFDVFGGLLRQEKISVASGREQDASAAPAVTSVITAQDIEASGARSLAEVLRMVPGMYVGRNLTHAPLYTLRGQVNPYSSDVLMLINGVPFKSATLLAWEAEPPVQNISRIEVIRGPGAALYGADAFSGVINIITKSAAEIDGTVTGLRAGSDDNYDAWLSHGGAYGALKVAATLQWGRVNGQDTPLGYDMQTSVDSQMAAVVPGYAPVSGAPGSLLFDADNLNAQVDLRAGRWRLNMDYYSQKNRNPSLAFWVVDPLGQVDTQRYGLDLTWDAPDFSPDWELSAQAAYREYDDAALVWQNPPGALLPGPCAGGLCGYPDGARQRWQANERQARLETSALYSGWSRHALRLGAGWSLEDLYRMEVWRNYGLDRDGNAIAPNQGMVDVSGAATALYQANERRNWHVYAQDSWDFQRDWQLTAGLRHDHYSDFGGTTNPRLSLVWQTTPRLTSKLLYGRAFRAPSFHEQSVYLSVFQGNPELKPETLQTYELAFNWRPAETLNFALNLFKYRIDDPIEITPVGATALTYANGGAWDGAGGEFEARWKISARAALMFNYAYADPQASEMETSNLYPRHKFYLRADWMLYPNWYVDAQVSRMMGFDHLPDYGARLALAPDYTSVDLTLRYRKARDWDWNLAVGVRNLFDAEIFIPSSTPPVPNLREDGRHWFVEARRRF